MGGGEARGGGSSNKALLCIALKNQRKQLLIRCRVGRANLLSSGFSPGICLHGALPGHTDLFHRLTGLLECAGLWVV